MTKLATTAVMCAALIGASTASFAGGLTSPIVEPVPMAPVMVDDGGLNWTHAAIAAGVIGVALIALADDGDDNDNNSGPTTTEAN